MLKMPRITYLALFYCLWSLPDSLCRSLPLITRVHFFFVSPLFLGLGISALPVSVPAPVPQYITDLRPRGALGAGRLLLLSGVRPPARGELF